MTNKTDAELAQEILIAAIGSFIKGSGESHKQYAARLGEAFTVLYQAVKKAQLES